MIVREDSGSIAVLRMAHGKVSALDLDLCHGLAQAIDIVAEEPHTALVLTGTGSAFSAGVDLFQVMNGGALYLTRFLPALDALLRTLLTFPKPLVAAINGHAIAGGCVMAAACDLRLMSEGGGRIGVPELIVGVPFPSLPFEIVRARVLPTALRRLVYRGDTVDAHEGVTLGVVDEVTAPDRLIERALEVAGEMSRIPAQTFALTKRLLVAPVLEAARAGATMGDAVTEAWASENVQAHIRAYVERAIKKTG
jgi:enoyl-CoA hydratase